MPGRGDLRRGRRAGGPEGLHPAQRRALPRLEADRRAQGRARRCRRVEGREGEAAADREIAAARGLAMNRGKLKIFFGAFPGAGKTNAMLTAARRVRAAGRDVVVGLVDTHDSPETAALLDGFEVLAPLAVAGSPVPG